MHLPVSWFDRVPTGSAVTRLTSDVEVLGEMFASGIITIIGDILLLIGIISVMLWMNLKLSLVTFSVLPVLVYVAYTFRRRMSKSFREVRARLGNLNAFLDECISGISIIQIFNRERDEERRFSELNASYRDANMPVIFWDASLYAMVEALSSIAVALIIWYGGGEIVKGALTFGVLVAFIQYIEKFFAPIRDLSAKYSVMQGAMAALERIFALLDTPATGTEPGRISLIPNADGICPAEQEDSGLEGVPLIEFRDVSFSYQDRQRHPERLQPCSPARGADRHRRGKRRRQDDHHPAADPPVRNRARQHPAAGNRYPAISTLHEVRRRVGVVLQDPCLFAGSIEFNICLGDEQARQRVRQAAAAVGADRFIDRLPQRL